MIVSCTVGTVEIGHVCVTFILQSKKCSSYSYMIRILPTIYWQIIACRSRSKQWGANRSCAVSSGQSLCGYCAGFVIWNSDVTFSKWCRAYEGGNLFQRCSSFDYFAEAISVSKIGCDYICKIEKICVSYRYGLIRGVICIWWSSVHWYRAYRARWKFAMMPDVQEAWLVWIHATDVDAIVSVDY